MLDCSAFFPADIANELQDVGFEPAGELIALLLFGHDIVV